jgi:non-ribosomal peptide synthetase component E (peptide arylation enzyme)
MNTLVDLIRVRASTSSQSITFLDEHGHVESSLSYAELYPIALDVSCSLHSSGLLAGTTNIVIANFADARSSIIAFWACCLGGFLS